MKQTLWTKIQDKWYGIASSIWLRRRYKKCKCGQYYVVTDGSTMEIGGHSHSKKTCFPCDQYGAPRHA